MALNSGYSDEHLLSLLKNSDTAAFTALYERYWKRMFAMAFLRLERRDLAEDIVQEVFTTLWQKRAVQKIHSLEAWLATAIKYQVITLVNRQLSREVLSTILPEDSTTDATLDLRFLEQQLALEINKLPEKCRLVFRYSREHDFSNRDISAELGISEKAVEKHITHARKKLGIALRSLLHSLFSLL